MHRFGHIDTWVFDLDNTLYDAEAYVFPEQGKRMAAFVSDLLGIPAEEARVVQKAFYKKYGTTLRGLMTEHNVEPDAYLDYVHDIDLSPVPDCPITRDNLQHLPGRRIIFTNAPRHFAQRMVKQLGIEPYFESIFAIEDALYWPKPHRPSYELFLKTYGIDPTKACMFEDMNVNLKTAHDLGMTTVWLHYDRHDPNEGIDDHIHHYDNKLSEWLQKTLPPRK